MTALLEWLFVDSVKTSLYCSFTFLLFSFFSSNPYRNMSTGFYFKRSAKLHNTNWTDKSIRCYNLIITITYPVGIKNDYIFVWHWPYSQRIWIERTNTFASFNFYSTHVFNLVIWCPWGTSKNRIMFFYFR